MKKILCGLLLACGITIHCAEIQIPANASLVERKAAEELKLYIAQLTGENAEIKTEGNVSSAPVFRIKTDEKMLDETWRIKSIADGVELSGSKGRGALYAVYHYLEDICGVRWWNPWEESVRPLDVLPVKELDCLGKPAFTAREIHATFGLLYGNDDGRFASRLRLTGISADYNIAAEYGGIKLFGPPYHCHTFAKYISADTYFKPHPEWFSLLDGKREGGTGSSTQGTQLCLSNKELRREMIKRLREFIRDGKGNAEKMNMEPPKIYDISQNDNMKYCQCPECIKVVEHEGGSQSGIMLDFVNEIADEIKKEYPDILISTFAYQYTEKLPKTIRPHSNVLVVLCDTLSNAARPVSPQDNPYFYNLLKSWSARIPNLRIWDYAVTYQMPNELPYASEYTYASDMKLFRDSKVKQVFTEFEYPITGDARDYKVYLRAKFLENPDADFESLSVQFSDGFYGAAGKLFRDYRRLLHESEKIKHPHISMFPTTNAFTHLDLKTIVEAQKIFDTGEKLLTGDETLLRRWNHARLSLDRATLIRKRVLMGEYMRTSKNVNRYPLDTEKILRRIRQTWTEQAKMRLKEKDYAKSIAEMEDELKQFSVPLNLKALSVPGKFRDISVTRVFDFTMETSSRWEDIVKIVEDPASETGVVARLAFPNKDPGTTLDKYKMPLLFGIYAPAAKKNLWAGTLTANAVLGAGYHWYKLGNTRLSPDCYMFFFWSWYIQQGIANAFDPNQENEEFEIWVCMKFTGPAYPYGKQDEQNAIWIERIVLVKENAIRETDLPEEKGVQINGVKKYKTEVLGDGWSFEYMRRFGLKENAPWSKELGLLQNRWRQHPDYNSNAIAGYNGEIILKLEAPGPITEVTAEGQITNYNDNDQRQAFLSCSLDGTTFQRLDEKVFAAGSADLKGRIELPAGPRTIWLKFGRTLKPKDSAGEDAFGAIFNSISIRLKGRLLPE